MIVEEELRLILFRNIIFPDNLLKILSLIKDGQLTRDGNGRFSLVLINDKNLNLPRYVTSLRKLVHDINSCDDGFKTLMELLIAGAKDTSHKHEIVDGFHVDPVFYTGTETINGKTVKIKRNGYKKIYQLKLEFDDSKKLLENLCTISLFKERHPKEYGLRVYFDSNALKTKKKTMVGSGITKEDIEKENKRIRDECTSKYIEQWKEIFKLKDTGEIACDVLTVLNGKDYVEIVRGEDVSSINGEHVKDDDRVINKTSETEGVFSEPGIFGYIKNMMKGGGRVVNDKEQYGDMKNKYMYEKDSIINQLLS